MWINIPNSCPGALAQQFVVAQTLNWLLICGSDSGRFGSFFTSRVMLERPHRIRVTYENGPFRYLNNQWVFTDTPKGTQVDFWVDFEFRNRLLQKAIGVVFSEAVKRMVSAFTKRARDTYGSPLPLPMSVPDRPKAAIQS